MLIKVKNLVLNKISSGHEQSVELKRNIAVSVLIKLLSLVVGIVYMPTILTFVDKSLLGIVMTIDSFVSWLYLADVGIGNGLKNKLTESIARDDSDRAKKLVSTAYLSLFSMLFVVFVIASIAASFINWNHFLKVDIDSKQLLWSVQFVLFALLFSFGIRLINTVYQAYQLAFLNAVSELTIKIVKLIAIFIAIRLTTASLLKFILIDHSIPIIVLMGFSLVWYNTRFKNIRPSLSHFCWGEVKNITSLGLKFFWLQIASKVLFTTDSVIIARLFTTADVAVYNIARHYYSQVWMIFSFIAVPLWAAYTKAYAKEDFDWIKRITKKILTVALVLSLLILVMFIFYQPIVRLWLRGKIEIPVGLSLIMALAQIVMLLTSPFSSLINGTAKVKLSLTLAPIVILLNVPLSILFAKPLGMGPAGVIFATLVCNGTSLIISSYQYYKIVYVRSNDIWNK